MSTLLEIAADIVSSHVDTPGGPRQGARRFRRTASRGPRFGCSTTPRVSSTTV